MATYDGVDKRLQYLFQNSGGGGGGFAYSLDEIKVGTWYDNRVIFQKSFVTTSQLSISTAWTNTGIYLGSEVDLVVGAECIRINTNAPYDLAFNFVKQASGQYVYRMDAHIPSGNAVTFAAGTIFTFRYIKNR